MKKTVLCFGDSNTWGYMPDAGERYAAHDRWPGVLQNALGGGFTVIEEGLNGRTTVWDDPIELHKNGAAYLAPCLDTHRPLDLVILMLGTNDLKKRFSLSPYDVAAGIQRLLNIIASSRAGREGCAPHVLLLSPPHIGPMPAPFAEMFEGAEPKSRQLAPHYAALAKQNDCFFLDTAEIASVSGIDGVHFDAQAHHKLGKRIGEQACMILEEALN